MSTDVYGVRVLARVGPRVTYRVYNVYGDWVGLPSPASWDFFVRIAADGRWHLSSGDPMRDELGEQQWDEAWMCANAARFVRAARVLETANYPGRAHFTFYYERGGHWVDEDRLPQVVYEVEYVDERFVAHMADGEGWGTTSYATDGPPRANADPRARAPEADAVTPDDATVHHCGAAGIESTDAGVAAAALAVLARAGARALPFARRVAQLVDDGDPSVARAAVTAAGALAAAGDPLCLSTLVVALGSPRHTRPRAVLIRALAQLGPRARLATDALARIARRGTPGERVRAAAALHAVSGTAGALEAVARGLATRSADARWAALDALASAQPADLARFAPALARGLADDARIAEWPAVLDLLARAGAHARDARDALARFERSQRDDRPAFAREAAAVLARLPA